MLHGWKDIWGDRLCSLLLLMCNSTARDRIQSLVHKSVYHNPISTPLNAISFAIALLQSYPHLLVSSSQLLWFLKCSSAQLSTQYMIQLEAFSYYCFPNPWIFSSSTRFSSLFCFSFCSLEPGFFLFLHTYYSCCKHLLICNLPSETDCLFLSASSIHSLFSNLNQKHRFSPCPIYFNFFLCVIGFMPECLN